MATAHFNFSGTTTVITGGASGIGLSCAVEVVKAGGNVVITSSRRPEKTQKAIDTLRTIVNDSNNNKRKKDDDVDSSLSPSIVQVVHAFPCEVGQEESVKTFFHWITNEANLRIDYVIHGAGISPNTEFFEQTQEEWDMVHNTNNTGTFLVTKYAALAMKSNPPLALPGGGGGDFRGRICLITSTNGCNSWDPISAHYDASKAGNNVFVRVAAEQLSRDRICVNGLAPGWVNTEMNATLPTDVRERESDKIWMKRWADPVEMAICALHLLTMPYLMGQVVMVDGGYR